MSNKSWNSDNEDDFEIEKSKNVKKLSVNLIIKDIKNKNLKKVFI